MPRRKAEPLATVGLALSEADAALNILTSIIREPREGGEKENIEKMLAQARKSLDLADARLQVARAQLRSAIEII